jgi:hypothetical protein
MHKVDSGILFAELLVNEDNTEFSTWDWTKFAICLNEITMFYDMGSENEKEHLRNTVKAITRDEDTVVLNIPFDEFAKIILKHRKESNIKIYN